MFDAEKWTNIKIHSAPRSEKTLPQESEISESVDNLDCMDIGPTLASSKELILHI